MTLRSVDHALTVLEILREEDSIGVIELAERLGVAASTAHRLLATLVARDFVVQDRDDRRYRLGDAAQGLRREIAAEECARRAREVLVRLARMTAETVNLAMLDGSDVLYSDCVPAGYPGAIPSRAGLRSEAHCSSAGKALLADFPQSAVDRLLPHDRLTVRTRATIATKTQLARELGLVRRRGYARDVEEWEAGTLALAVPVRARGMQRLALTIAAPHTRLRIDRTGTGTTPRERELVLRLRAASEELQVRLSR
ncbi:IclR family transcriptional regulator [Actinomycetospora atypica]|uniref:IclR family transcriptional regulator n=1 Tax=Actinomycetospora atypica TaxID=1290095 RepID=A0ABV9YQC4_9PSEU